MSGHTFLHDPDAVLDYKFGWSSWLAEGDTITGHAITVSPEGGLTVGTHAHTNDSVMVWLSGGTEGDTVRVTCHVETAQGREDDRSMFLRVRER